jgi:hypothetical protein
MVQPTTRRNFKSIRRGRPYSGITLFLSVAWCHTATQYIPATSTSQQLVGLGPASFLCLVMPIRTYITHNWLITCTGRLRHSLGLPVPVELPVA